MENLRPLLITYAYNITGCFDDAQDIVQDVYIKYTQVNNHEILNPDAYLKRMVINHAINHKKRHIKTLKDYPGEWLPEPIAAETADRLVIQKDILSYSLMVLLERLNAKQRAVFILKEAFDYEHAEIATILGTTEENARQLLARARKQVKTQNNFKKTDIDRSVLERYLSVIQQANTKGLEELLSDEIMIISDGGGKASAGLHPMIGRKNSVAMLAGIYRKFYKDKRMEIGTVNHLPALFYYEDGTLRTCKIFAIENNIISRIFILRNPDKLALLQKS